MPALCSVRLRSLSFGWCAYLSALVLGAASCSENGGADPTTSSGGTSAGSGAASGASGVTGAPGGSSGGGTAGAYPAGSSGAGGTTGGAGAAGGMGSGGGGAGGSAGSTGGGGTSGSSGASGNAGTAGNSGTSGSSGVGGSAGSGGGDAGAGSGSAGEGGEAGGSNDDYQPCPPDSSPCKILPFGDSITDGFGTGGAYRVELFRRAHQAGKDITFVGTGSNGPPMVDGVTFPANHEGHSGFTIDPTPSRSGISPLVGSVIPQFTPHIVTLMIGTNDCIDDYELANAPARLGALIDSIYQRLPDVLIVVAQPIPSREDPLNARIQSYNAALPAVVQARADAGRHIRLVDMYAPFVAVADYKTSLLKDTWHPNEAGHAILGERWYSVLADVL